MTTTLERPPTTAGLLRGEWIKARSLRSTWYVLVGSLVGMVLLGLLFTSTADDGGPGGNGGGPPGVDFAQPLTLALAGYNLAQLALGVLGVLLVTGEYTSGTIRSTFAAAPRRWCARRSRTGSGSGRARPRPRRWRCAARCAPSRPARSTARPSCARSRRPSPPPRRTAPTSVGIKGRCR